jgi:hypothetical protein
MPVASAHGDSREGIGSVAVCGDHQLFAGSQADAISSVLHGYVAFGLLVQAQYDDVGTTVDNNCGRGSGNMNASGTCFDAKIIASRVEKGICSTNESICYSKQGE